MTLYNPSRPNRRRLLPAGTAALIALLAWTPSAARAARLDLSYKVDDGMLVEACGGFAGTCREYVLSGSLELRLDADAGTAAMPAADLRIAEEGLPPLPLELPLADLAGTYDGRTVRLATPPEHRQTLAWTMTLSQHKMVLQGTFDEGCCDRFVFTFRNVSFSEAEDGEPASVLLLNGERFAVAARWTDFAGHQGQGRAIALNADSGYFWFFAADNTEVVVKVLDACERFGRFWFFAAGLTNVAVELQVTDLASGLERAYGNPLGRAFQPILDTDAFATCEVGGRS